MANHIPIPQAEKILSILDYDEENGCFYWKPGRCGVVGGKKAGSPFSNGYIRIKIDGKLYLSHRLIWRIHTGDDPGDFEIDHADLDRSNSRFGNLRLSTHGQNQANGKAYRNNKTGYRGVQWHKQHRKFISSIQVNKKSIHLGLFTTAEAAAYAYDNAAIKYFGEFARINGVKHE